MLPVERDDGRLAAGGCEVNVVDHCNLSCRGCSHLSPAVPRSFVDPDDVHRDLRRLAVHYAPDHVRLLGGEPLLHPHLLDVVAAVRASGITDRVRVVTNGVLLKRMGDEFWAAVDEVRVSRYPGVAMDGDDLDTIWDMARRHGVAMKVKRFDRFREAYSEVGTGDDDLVRRIFRTCQIAHVWECHTVHRGRFYRCPQSVVLPAIARGAELADSGIPIDDSSDFGDSLRAYLASDEPLAACRYCLGSAGRLFSHQFVRRSRWREPQERATEDLVDLEYLARLEQDPEADFDCISACDED